MMGDASSKKGGHSNIVTKTHRGTSQAIQLYLPNSFWCGVHRVWKGPGRRGPESDTPRSFPVLTSSRRVEVSHIGALAVLQI